MKNILLFLSISLLFSCTGKVQEATLLLKQGKEQEERGALDSAIISYKQAIELLEQTKNSEVQGDVYSQMGNLQLNNNLEADAFTNFRKAFHCYLTLKDKSKIAYSLRGIGKSYAYRFMPDSALHYYLLAYKLIPQIQHTEEIANLHNNLSNIYLELNRCDSALYHINKAIVFCKDSDDIYSNYSTKASIFISLHQYDSARIYLNKGLKSTKLYTQASCYFKLSQIAEQMGNTSAYIQYAKKFESLADSLERQNHGTQIVRAEKKLLQKDMHGQKQFFALVIIGIFLACIFTSYILVHRHRKKISKKDELLQKQEIAKQKTQSQIDTILDNIKEMGDTCKKKFIRSSEYQTLKDKMDNGIILSYKEQEEYSSVLSKYFNSYIQALSGVISKSSNDHYLCCLFLIGFNVEECAHFRSISEKGIRTQKSRLMQRVKKIFGEEITFELFFNLPQKQVKLSNK